MFVLYQQQDVIMYVLTSPTQYTYFVAKQPETDF